jgi:hypothetical protein
MPIEDFDEEITSRKATPDMSMLGGHKMAR